MEGSSMSSTLLKSDLDTQTITKAYARWAPVYDLVFGAVFERGRHAAIAAAERIGGRILEVGVGTGISLPRLFARRTDLRRRYFRADAAQGAGARRRARPEQCRRLAGDGRRASGLSRRIVRRGRGAICRHHGAEPGGALDEFARVLKPGGEIVLVSRVGAEAGLRRALEHWFPPAARKLGWRTEFSFERYARWAARTHGHARWSSAARCRRSAISR